MFPIDEKAMKALLLPQEEMKNRSSRRSFARAFVKILLRGLRNDRLVLLQMVARGEAEFVRSCRQKIEAWSGITLRQEDYHFIFAEVKRAADRLYKPKGWTMPKVH